MLSNDLSGLLKFNFNLYDLYKLDHPKKMLVMEGYEMPSSLFL